MRGYWMSEEEMRGYWISEDELRVTEEVMTPFFATVDTDILPPQNLRPNARGDDILRWNLMEITGRDPTPSPPTRNDIEVIDLTTSRDNRSIKGQQPTVPVASNRVAPISARTSNGVNGASTKKIDGSIQKTSTASQGATKPTKKDGSGNHPNRKLTKRCDNPPPPPYHRYQPYK